MEVVKRTRQWTGMPVNREAPSLIEEWNWEMGKN